MDRQSLLKLYKDNELSAYISAQARRHFSCIEDQEDVRQEAYVKLAELKRAPCSQDVRPIALRVIRAAYMRSWRRRSSAERPFDVNINPPDPDFRVNG